jgi:hypothetical protein
MSPSQPPSATAAAHQVLAALEQYRGRVQRLVSHFLDAELYQATSSDLDAVRSACAAVPALSAAWVALLIAHAEFVHGLWQSTRAGDAPTQADRQALLDRVLETSTALQRACMALVGR